jgi:hypothetical protein
LYHPELASYGTNVATEVRAWLWDGNDRFIECQLAHGRCQSPSLSMEGLGDYDLASGAMIRVNDRGRTGGVTMSRSGTVFSGFGEAPTTNPRLPFYAPCSSGDPYNVICPAQHDGKLTADGWTLDYETWQGVRTSDLSVGQWNTPDAYAGDVHDPATQKPFMWNHNNAYAYVDPSGYQSWFGPFIDSFLHLEIHTDEQRIAKYPFAKTGFASRQLAEEHFDKHVVAGHEFTFTSLAEYVKATIEFRDNPGPGSEARYDSRSGTLRLYNPTTNIFGSYNRDGTTKTMFKPQEGRAYWDDRRRNPGDDVTAPGQQIDTSAFVRVCWFECSPNEPWSVLL